ncbi:DUF4349 domain-containing protein [Peribacillus frigoritolerans]|uniref:DUF4349 domain-containing protein n=1 Tax=Peribacillus frigoritolerans TaxID=450367 RepID=UPI0025708FBF|nr:DUF4349 domain-containing protein [Peribacillus frigoritolerans]
MKKMGTIIVILFLALFSAACSSSESGSDKSAESSGGESAKEMADSDMTMNSEGGQADKAEISSPENKAVPSAPENRKVIYTADLSIRVKNFNEAVSSFQSTIASLGGYVIESNTYTNDDDMPKEGSLTVKVPQDKFQSFLKTVEKGSVKVNQQTVTGQDVTEEYVDLESRLKAKNAVEERLLSFMKDAQKTEDLLKISSDLSAVQEEMEQITGRINYLKNQTSFATITMQISEDKVTVPGLENKDLNTWDKTKKQFMESLNSLLAAGSALIVFTAGNLPVLLVLFLICFALWLGIKKYMNKGNSAPPTDMGE